MSTPRRASLSSLLLAATLSLGLASCDFLRPDQEDVGVDGTSDTVSDTSDTTSEDARDTTQGECTPGDAGTGCGNRGVCNDQGECVCNTDGQCGGDTPACDTRANECVECTSTRHCSEGEICNPTRNECVAGPCSQGGTGTTCDPDGRIDNGWKCIDAGKGPVCMKSCTQGTDEQPSKCGSSEVCLPSSSESGAPAVCYPSQCQGPADTQRCSNVSEHALFGQYSNGAKCANYSVENCGSASLCVPSGTQSTGDPCNVTTPAQCSGSGPCMACQAGNTCRGGRCRAACTSDGDCSGDNSCVGLDDSAIVGSGQGFCAESCKPYDPSDQCSASGEGCRALTDESGYCGNVGTKGYMESCQPRSASNPDRYECKSGFRCLRFQQTQFGTVARCVPSCAAPAADDQQTRDNDATCGGTFYGRVTYAHDMPSQIDLYTNGSRRIDNLASGRTTAGQNAATANFFELDVGSLNRGNVEVAVTAGSKNSPSNPAVRTDVVVASGIVQTWLVHSTGQLSVTPIPLVRDVSKPAAGAGNAKVRAANLVPDYQQQGTSVDVDIVAVPSGQTLNQQNKIVLAEELGSAAVGSFVTIPKGGHTLYVFPASANHQSGNSLFDVSGVNFSGRSRTTVAFTGTASTTDSVAIETTKIRYASAPDAPRFRCLGGGICLNQCRTADYGTNWCSADSACAPLQGSTNPSFCLPDGGTKTPGEQCTPSTLYPPCEEGASCITNGTGSGTCRSLCIGGTDDSNSVLQCGSGTTCSAGEGILDACRTSCSDSDGDLKDPNCPANLKSCIPEFAGEGDQKRSFCSSSGAKAEGEKCGGSHQEGARGAGLVQNCQPGTICAHPSGGTDSFQFALQGMFLHRGIYGAGVCQYSVEDPMAPDPTCRPTCDPFSQNPGCPSGQACMIDLLHGTSLNGVCLEKGEGITSPAASTKCGTVRGNTGKMCGRASICLPQQAGGGTIRRCFQFCKLDDQETSCAGGANCEPVSGLGAKVGVCRM